MSYRDNLPPLVDLDPAPERDKYGHFKGCQNGSGCAMTRCRELWPYIQQLRAAKQH